MAGLNKNNQSVPYICNKITFVSIPLRASIIMITVKGKELNLNIFKKPFFKKTFF